MCDFCQRMLSSVCSEFRYKRVWHTPQWILNLSHSVLLHTAWYGNLLVLDKISSISWRARLAVLVEVVWLQVWKWWVELWGVCGVALWACGILWESNLLKGKELLWRNGERFGTLNRLLVNSVLKQSAFHRVVVAQDSVVHEQSKKDALKFLWASYEHNRRQMCNHTEAMQFFLLRKAP